MRCAPAIAIALVLALVRSRPAHADPGNDPQQTQLAQRLFEEARESFSRGETSRACGLFAESQRLDPASGTQLNLALCHEHEGKLGTAYFELEEALARAVKDGRADREEIARTHLEALGPRAPRLTIARAPDDAPERLIELDGVPFRADRLTVRADPGLHTVRASAAGRAPWTWAGTLREGDDISVNIPVLAGLDAQPQQLQKTTTTTTLSTASWVLGGVAVAALATSVVTGAVALHDEGVYRDTCNDARLYCPDSSGADAASSARKWAWVSTGALAGGVAAGLISFLLPRSVRVVPAVGIGVVGGAASVTF